MKEEKVSSQYMLQLDALRAFAVGAVIVHHFVPGALEGGGYIGVKLFFCISGFLITGILLKARNDADENKFTKKELLWKFYVRRFLRIFPLYYLVIGVTFAINLDPVRKILVWLLSYTLNIHMAAQGWYELYFSHFWSLAVEEQFYIFWPWIILFLKREWLFPAIISIIFVGPLYRLSYVVSHYENMTALSTYISTFSSLDHLGFGSLLALLVSKKNKSVLSEYSYLFFLFSTVLYFGITNYLNNDVNLVLTDSVTAIIFCCIIYWMSRRVDKPLAYILEWKPLLYLGRISYGLYVYHPFMPFLAIWLLLKFGIHAELYSFPVVSLALVLTLMISSVSWHFFEKPINDLKKYFV
ncbi:MAG: acyltransferase [Chlorobiaceae bacterium]|nr:acyltransferase [Chlorobiaceae bacterium]